MWMRSSFGRVGISLFIASLLLACSLTIPTTVPTQSATESPYRYDELPSPVNESAAISEYRAISKWDDFDVTYFFENGTDQLVGDSERDLIRWAFGLWSDHTPLTFTEVAN